jgi:pimeloyl-ACP methyl ester carboxylesterase
LSFERARQPGLEVLRAGEGRAGRPPLVFIHGGFAGAWCWDVHFLDWFATRGWECHAPSLRGHGESEGREDIHRISITSASTITSTISPMSYRGSMGRRS